MAGPCLDWEGASCGGLCDYLDQEGVGCLDYLDGWELTSDNSTIAEEETLENHGDGFLEEGKGFCNLGGQRDAGDELRNTGWAFWARVKCKDMSAAIGYFM